MNSLLACVSVAIALGTVRGSTFVDAEDRKVADMAAEAASDVCTGGFKGQVDQEAGHKVLMDGAGGENKVLDILKAANSSDDLQSKVEEELTVQWLISIAGPTIMAFILIGVWLICCWTACPCCVCCRVCRSDREKPTSKCVKLLALVLMIALVLAIVFTGLYAYASHGELVDGFDNMACSTATLVNTTLSGSADLKFVGFLPLLTTFDELLKQLEPGSVLMTDINTALDSTKEVSDAVHVASSTLQLLQDSLADNANPGHKHACKFCSEVSPRLQEVIDALNNGLGVAFNNARSEVDKQLTGPARQDLHDTVQNAMAPIMNTKKTVRDSFGWFVDKDKFAQVREHATSTVLQIVMSIIVLALMLAVCACMGTTFFCCREYSGGKPNSMVPPCACMSWCWAFWYAILAFFFGGILSAVAVPISSVCLVLDDLNGSLAREISGGLGVSVKGDEGEMLFDMVDLCLRPANSSLNADLLSIVKTRENSSAPLLSLRESVVDKSVNMIRSQFDELSAKMRGFATGTANTTLADSSEVIQLRDAIKGKQISAFILPDDGYDWRGDADFSGLFSTAGVAANLPNVALLSSIACEVFATSQGDIPSIRSFVDVLDAVGNPSENTIAGCIPESVDCQAGGGEAACEAGRKFLGLKRALRDADYSCYRFEDPSDSGKTCDVLNMDSDGNNDCLGADGTTKVKKQSCSLAEFELYMQQFDERIDKVMKRVDSAATSVATTILLNMTFAVEEHVLTPVLHVADRLRCGFLAGFYQETIDGLCYQSVKGFNQIGQCYVACALLCLLLLLLTYAVWRRSIDNVNASKKNGSYQSRI